MIYLSDLVLHTIKQLNKNKMHTGRTNIQKMIFFAIKDTKILLNVYKPYHYGPFSEQLQSLMQRLEELEYIEYDRGYKLNQIDHADKMVQKNADRKYKNNIDNTIKFLKEHAITDVKDIAAFSKVYYYFITNPKKSKKKLNIHIQNNAPFVWPSLMDYKDQFKNYIDTAQDLNSELK